MKNFKKIIYLKKVICNLEKSYQFYEITYPKYYNGAVKWNEDYEKNIGKQQRGNNPSEPPIPPIYPPPLF